MQCFIQLYDSPQEKGERLQLLEKMFTSNSQEETQS